MNALGMVEVCGFTTSIRCADIAAKAADVKIIALDKNKPANGDSAEVPLNMCVKIEGSVAAVETAVEAASAYAKEIGLYVTSHVISRLGIGTEKMAKINEVGKDRWVDKKEVKETVTLKTEKKKETAEAVKVVEATGTPEVTTVKKTTRGRPPKSK